MGTSRPFELAATTVGVGLPLCRVSWRVTVANLTGKAVVGGAFAAILAAFAPASAQTVVTHPQFGGAPVQLDPYNGSLAVVAAPSEAVCQLWRSCVGSLDQIGTVYQQFSGPPIFLDGYNETLTTAALSVAEAAAVADPRTSYALASGYTGPRVWEGPITPDK